MTAPIPETAGVIIHAVRVPTEWGAVRIHLVALPEGRSIRLILPVKLPEEFRKAVARAGKWAVANGGRTEETVAVIESLIREALTHE